MKTTITSILISAATGLALLCAMAAGANADPLDPNDFTSLGANPFTMNGTHTIDTAATPPVLTKPDSSTINGVVSNGIAVFTFDDITIGAGVTVNGLRNAGSRPLALLSHGGITNAGTINVNGVNGANFSGINGGNGGSVEAGGGGTDGSGNHGGGGAFGGNGGNGFVSPGGGGTAYGDLALTLQGGSGGAGGKGSLIAGGGGGGGAGGAVELGALGNSTLGGMVLANGGAGGFGEFSAGGGAGGGIFVHAPTVSLSGNLNASGGDGGGIDGGGGGGGRVLILTADGTLAGGSLGANVNVSGGGSPSGGAGSNGVAEVGIDCDFDTVLTVTTTSDSGPGSLRDAIDVANACPGKNIIEFAPSAYGTITLTSGELLITDDLCILGPGATNVAVNGNAASRVFHVGPGIDVTIASLTITNGNAGGFLGGGIYNDHATLTVSNATVSGNMAGGGGGIRNNGRSGSASLTIVNSTLSGNSVAGGGGGILNEGVFGSATLTIINSTLSGNSAANGGGGIDNDGDHGSATLTIVNSTLSGNSASGGGGIVNVGPEGSALVHIGSTILTNTATSSGTNIFNSAGTVTSDGYNLSSDNGGGFLTATGDQINTDPKLGPLQLNGGQTPTHALLCGSPAIDHGTNFTGAATDQTGAPRTFDDPGIANVGDGTDIGAFELQIICNQPPVAVCTNVTVSAGMNCTADGSIDNGSYDPDNGDSIVSTNQSPAGPYPLGTTPVTLTVTDTHGAMSSCMATVTVADTTAPMITCPGNITSNAAPGQCSAVVTFAPTVQDNCDASPTVICTPASGATFAKGTTNVTCKAFDQAGNTNTCSFAVTVVDNQAPVITVKPPINVMVYNHTYRTFVLADLVASVSDNCGGLAISNCVISQATSDEPDDVAGPGDGNTKNDIKIASGCKSVQLRQERDGGKNGRVYHVTIKLKDSAGNIGQAVATVNVPLSSNQMPAIDSGVAFTVNGCTP